MCKDSMDLEKYKKLNHDEHIVPEGVTKIYPGAFNGCYELKRLVLPEGVTTIEDSAFNGCHSLHEIVIPESLTNIDNYFRGVYWPYSLNLVLPNGKKISEPKFFEEWKKNKAQKGEEKQKTLEENDSSQR